jgi:Holliday junction resolvasome RuvABC endonuclease subunit
MSSRFCSIDASTTSVAFAVFEDDDLRSHGKITFEGNSPYERVADATKKLYSFFKVYEKFDYVVIEQTAFLNSPKTLSDLAMVHGAIIGAISLANETRVKSVPPIAWQTFIKNGRLTTPEKLAIRNDFPGKSDNWYKTKEREFRKRRTISFINDRYKKRITDNDIADAIGVGHYAIFNWDKLF